MSNIMKKWLEIQEETIIKQKAHMEKYKVIVDLLEQQLITIQELKKKNDDINTESLIFEFFRLNDKILILLEEFLGVNMADKNKIVEILKELKESRENKPK